MAVGQLQEASSRISTRHGHTWVQNIWNFWSALPEGPGDAGGACPLRPDTGKAARCPGAVDAADAGADDSLGGFDVHFLPLVPLMFISSFLLRATKTNESKTIQRLTIILFHCKSLPHQLSYCVLFDRIFSARFFVFF
jgi:hypothetical protein